METMRRTGPPLRDAKGKKRQQVYGLGVSPNKIKADLAAIFAATEFHRRWARSEPTQKGVTSFLTQLEKHISQLERVWQNVRSRYSLANFDAPVGPKGSTMNTALAAEGLDAMWTRLVSMQDEYDCDTPAIVEPHAKEEQKLQRIALTGIHVGHTAYSYSVENDDGLADKGAVRAPVYISWSKDRKPMYRAYSGKMVRQ
jgi:hypothetical protein